MQYFFALMLVLIFVALVIIAFNSDILVKKMTAIDELLERIAEALEDLIRQDDKNN